MDEKPDLEALAARVRELEGRVETVEKGMQENSRELRANTLLTKDLHSAVFGTVGEKTGMQDRVEEMYSVVEMGRSFFRGANRIATAIGAVADWVSRMLKRFWWLIAITISLATYYKTGKWEWPVWPG